MRYDSSALACDFAAKLQGDWELVVDVWYLADQADGWKRWATKALAPIMGLAVLIFGTVPWLKKVFQS